MEKANNVYVLFRKNDFEYPPVDVLGIFSDQELAEKTAEMLRTFKLKADYEIRSFLMNGMVGEYEVDMHEEYVLLENLAEDKPMTVFDNDLRVDWSFIGEGWYGDYLPDDPEDEPLLRFDVFFWNKESESWEEIPDASYCTTNSAELPAETLRKILLFIFKKIRSVDFRNQPIKRLCEELSWAE